ncbi:monocarboxylate transporter 13-like [Ptychodera flava]|uniref:monocarboxylate transporter 13-like n=1 Tax=Ptychodera flava TaxID=63121 RepID=UPI00396A3C54
MAIRQKHEADAVVEGGLWGWLSVIGLFTALYFIRGTNVALGIFFVSFVEHFKEGAGKTSWVLSLAASLSWMIGPVSSAFAKKFGPRKVVTVGAALSVVSIFLSSFSSQLWQIIITLGFLNGLGYGILIPVSISFLAVHFRKRHPLASGLAFTGIGVGSMSLPSLIQLWIDTYWWRGALVVFSGASAHLLFSAAVLVMPPKAKKRKAFHDREDHTQEPQLVETANSVDDGVGGNQTESDQVSLKITTKTSQHCAPLRKLGTFMDCSIFQTNFMFDVYTICFFIFSIGQIISTVHLAPHLRETLLSNQKTASLLSFYGLGLIIGGPFWGLLISCFHLKGVSFMAFMMLLHGVTIALFPLASSVPAIIALLILLGFQRGGYSSQSNVAVRQIVDDAVFMTAIGWHMMFGSIGQLIGAPLSGYLRDYTGSYHYSFYAASAVIMLSGLVLGFSYFLLIRRQQKKQKTELTQNGEGAKTIERETTTAL